MRVGLFTDAFADRPLGDVVEWLAAELPDIRDVEIGTGGYSPALHAAVLSELGELRLSALNVSGNPLEVPEHDRALRETIVDGVPTTRDLALEVLASEPFRSGVYSTSTLEGLMAANAALA